MQYKEAKKLVVNDFVWVPSERQNGRIMEIQKDQCSNDLYLRVSLDGVASGELRHDALYHHTAVQKSKTLDEVVAFFLADKKTRVGIKYNNETGEWLYSIWIKDSGDFWLCSFSTKEEAEHYIVSHNLKRCDV